jgi:hypothetical protein
MPDEEGLGKPAKEKSPIGINQRGFRKLIKKEI